MFVLLGLIVRAVGIEYRGKRTGRRWTRIWDLAIGVGSFVVAFGVGAALAISTTGLPLDEHGDRVGGAFAWFTPAAILGGLAVAGFALVHGATFLALKADGPVRVRARRFAVAAAPVALLPITGWVLLIQWQGGNAASWALTVVAVLAVVLGWIAARAGREGWGFTGIAAFAALGAAAIFAAVYPVVLPSTIDAAYDLTIANAASGEYTLGVMTVVAACGLPVVLLYQGWTYWVFRRRIAPHHIPDPHDVVPAVRTAPAARP